METMTDIAWGMTWLCLLFIILFILYNIRDKDE